MCVLIASSTILVNRRSWHVLLYSISKWEKSVTELDISTIEEIATLVNHSIERLFTDFNKLKVDATNSGGEPVVNKVFEDKTKNLAIYGGHEASNTTLGF